jgi:CO dehydrogenase maturation factor
LVVVEPSFESVSLAERIKQMANGIGIKRIWAILNKVNSEALKIKLSDELTKRNVTVIGAIPYDEEVFIAGLEGQPLTIRRGIMEDTLHKIIDLIL